MICKRDWVRSLRIRIHKYVAGKHLLRWIRQTSLMNCNISPPNIFQDKRSEILTSSVCEWHLHKSPALLKMLYYHLIPMPKRILATFCKYYVYVFASLDIHSFHRAKLMHFVSILSLSFHFIVSISSLSPIAFTFMMKLLHSIKSWALHWHGYLTIFHRNQIAVDSTTIWKKERFIFIYINWNETSWRFGPNISTNRTLSVSWNMTNEAIHLRLKNWYLIPISNYVYAILTWKWRERMTHNWSPFIATTIWIFTAERSKQPHLPYDT